MPAESHSSSSCEYINTLGEVEGFCSVIITSLLVTSMLIFIVVVYQLILSDFVLDLNLSVCDLHYRESVKFTYERMMVLYVLGLTMLFSVHRQSPSLLMIFIHFSLVLTYLIICHCFSSFTLIILHSLPSCYFIVQTYVH